MMSQLSILRSNRQFQTIAISQTLTVFGSNLLIPVLPVYLKLQGFSDTKIGILMGITALGALVVRPWCGKLVDQQGSRPVILLGQILTALGVAAYFFIVSFLPLLLLRFFQGVALAFYGTASVTFASSVEIPERTAGAIALYTVFTMIGVSSATSSAPFLFDSVGFQTLLAIGLSMIIVGWSVMFQRGETIPPVTGVPRTSFLAVLKTKDVLGPTVCLFASNFACITAFTFVPLLALARGIPFSGFFIGFMIAVIAARLVVNRLTDFIGTVSLATGASLFNVLGMVAVALYPVPATLFFAGCLIGVGFGLIFPIAAVHVVQHTSPANKGAALGILTGAGDIGNALGASFLGIVADLFGYSSLFFTSAAVVLLCTWHFYVLLGARNPDVSSR